MDQGYNAGPLRHRTDRHARNTFDPPQFPAGTAGIAGACALFRGIAAGVVLTRAWRRLVDRQHLREMDAHLLRDIGLTGKDVLPREGVLREVAFEDVPSSLSDRDVGGKLAGSGEAPGALARPTGMLRRETLACAIGGIGRARRASLPSLPPALPRADCRLRSNGESSTWPRSL